MQEIIKNYPSAKEAKERYSQDALREYAESVLMNEEAFKLLEKECIVDA